MGLFDGLDISASGLTAERLRLDVIANNVANANTTRTPEGGPYRREVVGFAARPSSESFASQFNRALGSTSPSLGGVEVTGVTQDTTNPLKRVYDPSNPDAVRNPASPDYGYVLMPNVDISTEMIDIISASRAYDANVTVLDASKSMTMKALQIGS